MTIAVTRDEAHNYRQGDLGPFVSVTTIVAKGKADPTALKGWERRHAIEYLRDKFGSASSWNADALESEIVRDALRKADTGTAVHAEIERHIKVLLTSGGKQRAVSVLHLAYQMDQFFTFERIRGVRWLASEVPLLCECHEIGGTVDALAMVDGKITVVDFKTGRRTWLDHVLQLAGYWHLLEVNGTKPQAAGILHLADGEPYEWHPIMPTLEDFNVLMARKLDYEWQQRRAI